MTARSEEAKAELKVAEQKLADAKAELASAEAKQEQVEQKLMETKQADPANTAEIQRLEQKLQGWDDAVKELGLSVISKSTIVRRLESQLPVIAGPALASSGGEKMHRVQSRHRPQHNASQRASLTTSSSLSLSLCLSLSLSPSFLHLTLVFPARHGSASASRPRSRCEEGEN